MNDTAVDIDQTDEDVLTHDEVSDEALEAAASTVGAPARAASTPFTYVSGFCC
jgi:hypothetical protein